MWPAAMVFVGTKPVTMPIRIERISKSVGPPPGSRSKATRRPRIVSGLGSAALASRMAASTTARVFSAPARAARRQASFLLGSNV